MVFRFAATPVDTCTLFIGSGNYVNLTKGTCAALVCNAGFQKCDDWRMALGRCAAAPLVSHPRGRLAASFLSTFR